MRNEALDLLNDYIGTWKTTGKLNNGKTIKGEDVYEWIDGQFFMVHRVSVKMGREQVSAVEITHYDELEDVFRSQSFGHDGQISISTLKIRNKQISIEADGQRFNGSFKGNTIEGVWEQWIAGCWQKWMDITLAKQINA